MSQTFHSTYIPELGTPTRGKVRDIYDLGDKLLMIATDRISCFDRVLEEQLQHKGNILTQSAYYWFTKTRDIIPNHVLGHPDPNILIVKKCTPIPIEVVVRGYLAGSLLRDYIKGERQKCGVFLSEGLKEYQSLMPPIITPTTKSKTGHDEDKSTLELISQGLVSADLWKEIEKVSFALFSRGQQLAQMQGLLLVDTKYEFGLDSQNNLTLIDEIHTPDSSRYWFKKEYEAGEIQPLDKEYVREWLRNNGFTGEGTAPSLPKEIQEEATLRYIKAYEAITGEKFWADTIPLENRIVQHLKEEKLIKGYFVPIIMGSEKDSPFVERITQKLHQLNIPHQVHVASAHKNPLTVLELIKNYDSSIEPIVYITTAGKSNALSGFAAAQSKWPVIACPPSKDQLDYLINIHSTLQMPSGVPVMTIIDPENAALGAARILRVR